jgi:membrane protease YdiL (CAAX protease family)
MIENAIAALILSALYIVTGRNLLAPIVAHGVTDTVDITLIFTHHYPGL